MKCSEIQDLLSAYYDSQLATDLQVNVDGHVVNCTECTAELAVFGNLSSMTADLDQPETPASVWAGVERGLEFNGESDDPAEMAQRELRPPDRARREIGAPGARNTARGFRGILQYTAAVAATVLIGIVGWALWPGVSQHETMVRAMEQVATEINSDGVTTLLLNQFGGSEVTYQNAIKQVGFRPVASNRLPEGYSVESIQVLNMPCCKCAQTACLRPDKTRLLIYEHENEAPGWFEHRRNWYYNCGGTDCKVVEVDDQLVATFRKGNRHVTLLGVRDEKEIELLVSQFEDKS